MPKTEPGSATVRETLLSLFREYEALMDQAEPDFASTPPGTSLDHLTRMCRIAQREGQAWPIDKLSRWLGFVQGVLAMRGLITVDGERERTRPLFHAAYAAEGLDVPARADANT